MAKYSNIELTQDPNHVDKDSKLILTWNGPWFFDGEDHGPMISRLLEEELISEDDFLGSGFFYKDRGEIYLYSLEDDVFPEDIFQMMPYLKEIDLESMENERGFITFTKESKVKEKNRKQRKRRNKNRQRNGVPYYGPWWVGVTYPAAVYDHEDFHSGGGTTEQSTGGDFGGGMVSTMASIRESVLQEGLEHMGYLGCFYCKRSVEEIRTLVTSKFMDTDYLVPSCPDCRR